jgi:hypothetical protein
MIRLLVTMNECHILWKSIITVYNICEICRGFTTDIRNCPRCIVNWGSTFFVNDDHGPRGPFEPLEVFIIMGTTNLHIGNSLKIFRLLNNVNYLVAFRGNCDDIDIVIGIVPRTRLNLTQNIVGNFIDSVVDQFVKVCVLLAFKRKNWRFFGWDYGNFLVFLERLGDKAGNVNASG